MGIFDDIGDFFTKTIPKTAKKAVRGVKSIGSTAVRGLKSAGKTAVRGLKSAGETIKSEVEGLANPEAWKQGLKIAGKVLQAPAKAVEKFDKEKGLGKYMGDFSGLSPLTLATSIATAPISGAGYLTNLAVDKKLQKKLRSGDAGTIMDTAFSGISLVPISAVGSGVKAVGRGGKAVIKGSRGLFKKGAKAISKLRR